MNEENKKLRSIIEALDNCGYKVEELKQQYRDNYENNGGGRPTFRLFLTIVPSEDTNDKGGDE